MALRLGLYRLLANITAFLLLKKIFKIRTLLFLSSGIAVACTILQSGFKPILSAF